MKLIQQLERKLSWRKKPTDVGNYLNKATKNNSTVKVIDSEFSRYIHFNNPSVNEWPTSDVNPTYEIVSIKPRVNIHQNMTKPQQVCNNQPSSPSREEDFDVHMYHNIDDIRPTFVRCHKDHSFDSTTVNNVSKRNRIRTNPWFNSYWSKKDSISSDTNRECSVNMTNNIYECIDWEDAKENIKPTFRRTGMSTFALPTAPLKPARSTCSKPKSKVCYSVDSNKSSTFLKPRIPQQYYDPYPRSPLQHEQRLHLVAPSPEFLTQSQQLCNEISQYVSSNHLDENDLNCMSQIQNTSHFSKPTLKVSSKTKNTKQTEDINNNSECSFDLFPNRLKLNNSFNMELERVKQRSTSTTNKRIAEHNYCRPAKRKRPDSGYSQKVSKRIDRIKTELEQIVIPAILAAQREDTKRI